MSTTQQVIIVQSDLLDPDFEIKSFEDALDWVRARNPNMALNHPEDVDWQALKAEGRRT